jgi:hypothetical protein
MIESEPSDDLEDLLCALCFVLSCVVEIIYSDWMTTELEKWIMMISSAFASVR